MLVVAVEFVLFIAFFLYAVYVSHRYLCKTATEKVVVTSVLMFFGYCVGNYYFGSAVAREQTWHPAVIAMIIVVMYCMFELVRSMKLDTLYAMECERQAADLP